MESTSKAAPVDNIYDSIGALKITCKIVDSSYYLSDHADFQLE